MSDLLESLFYGNICPVESIRPSNTEYKLVSKEISIMVEAYQHKLSTEDFNELEKLIDLLGKSTSMYAAATYSEGFRLGALMLVEVLRTTTKS